MALLYPEQTNPRTLSPLTLAFVGDGVYELLVRERLACEGSRPAGDLHKRSVAMVRAEAQAAAVDRLLPMEALFGYLYLQGNIERVQRLFRVITGDTNPESDQE